MHSESEAAQPLQNTNLQTQTLTEEQWNQKFKISRWTTSQMDHKINQIKNFIRHSISIRSVISISKRNFSLWMSVNVPLIHTELEWEFEFELTDDEDGLIHGYNNSLEPILNYNEITHFWFMKAKEMSNGGRGSAAISRLIDIREIFCPVSQSHLPSSCLESKCGQAATAAERRHDRLRDHPFD